MRLNKTVSDIELTEGVTPNSVDFKVESVETSPTQYGMLGIITDRLEAMSLIDLIPRMGEEIADNMARCIDKAIQAELLADGVNVRYAGSASSVAALTAVDNLTPWIVARSWATLDTWGAKKFGDDYICVTHGNCIYDLKTQAGDNTWVDFHKYNAQEAILNGEIGKLYGVRFISSSNIDMLAGSASGVFAYPCFFLGQGAFGLAKLMPYKMYYVGFTASGSDGLAQRASVGAKVDFASAVLQQQALLRVNVASTINDAWATNVDGTLAL